MSTAVVVAIALLVELLLARPALAQFPLNSAKGESTLIAEAGSSLINYEVSESRVGFTIDTYDATDRLDAQGNPIIGNSARWLFDVGLSATKGKRDLFKGGDFTPGFDVALTHVWTIEKMGPGFHQFYGRFRVDQASYKTATFTAVPDQPSTAAIDKATGVAASFLTGYNLGVTEDFVIGVGASFGRRWNSIDGRDPRQVCIGESVGVNSDGKTVTAAECEDRYVGELPDEWATQLRSDVIYRFTTIGTNNATLGLLGAFSVDFASDKPSSFNLSIGPSIQRPGYPNQVVFAALFEGIDIGNRLGESPKFTDQLRFRVYVGVPFDLFK